MIGKVIGTGNGFRGVVNYLLLGKKGDPNPDRVSWVGFRNLLTEDPESVPGLMRATANQSARCKSPVYHYAISWHRDHSPSDELMRDIADATLKDMGLEEHQVLLMAHDDTAHRHVHIIANRVHPETTRAWSNSHDYRRLEVSLRKQAEARGLPYVPGRFNDPEKFSGKGRGPRDGDYQAAVRHGKRVPKSMWSKDDIAALRGLLAPIFTESTSWSDLSAHVAALGLRVALKGQGLIIEGADGFMKLSDLGKAIRLKTLEATFGERFGDFCSRSSSPADGYLQPAAHLLQNITSRFRGSDVYGLPSSGDEASGDGDFVADAVRDRPRKPSRAARTEKPSAADSDDDTPGASLRPQGNPRAAAYQRVRAARADLQKVRLQALTGESSPADLLNAEVRLKAARQELELQLAAPAKPETHAPTHPPEGPVESKRAPGTARPMQTPATSLRASPDARSEAFGALRAARQVQDMAEALFNAGVINEEDLKTAADDVKRASEKLRPHLSLQEQLENDVAAALRATGRKSAPKKGGPSR